MEKNVIINLIENVVSGEATSEDKIRLNKLIAENPTYKELYEEYQMIWNLSKPSFATPSFNAEKAAATFKERLAHTKKPLKVVSKNNPFRLSNLLKIAAVFTLLTGAGFLLKGYLGQETASLVEVNSEADGNKKIDLKDGSKIILANGNSSLRYDSNFGSKNRNVELHGKAYFDIQRDESNPFIIKADAAQITVLGTQFTVNTLEDGVVEVMVEEGSVELKPLNAKTSIVLVAGEKGFYNRMTKQLYKREANLNRLAWATQKLSFKNNKLSDVIRDLMYHYGVEIAITSDRILDCHYTSLFVDENIDNILEAVSATFNFTIRSNETKTSYTLIGGSCK